MTVVVDASVAVKWVVEEDNTDDALALWDLWQETAELVIAPPLFRSEVANVLHRYVRQRYLSLADASDALDALLSRVATAEPPGLYGRALSLAWELGLSSTYDALYLALAEAEACEVWTADQRLVRSAQPRFGQVRWVGERGGRSRMIS